MIKVININEDKQTRHDITCNIDVEIEIIQMYCSDSIHIYRAVYEVHMYIYMLGYR